MRHHFKVTRVCSSDNYELSIKVYREYLEKEHAKNINVIKEIASHTVIKKKAYYKFYDMLIPINEIEISLHPTLTIVYK